MTNTEMVIFSADGDSSAVSYSYGTGYSYPEPDSGQENCYNYSYIKNSDETVTMTATRPLECTGITDLDGSSYVVKLDADLQLITGWNPSNQELSFHDNNYSEFVQMLSSTGTCEVTIVNKNVQYYTHGVFMWTGWSLIGLLQIYTNRYWRHYWRWSKTIHAILGLFSMSLGVTASFIALKTGGW